MPPKEGADHGVRPWNYRALTLMMDWPLESTRWTAQARQGSKEWMVRITSRGFSGSATGLPIKEAS